MAGVVGCKISHFLYLCSGNHRSSASGETAARVRAFLKGFAGFALTRRTLFGSDIRENCVEGDSSTPTLAIPLPRGLAGPSRFPRTRAWGRGAEGMEQINHVRNLPNSTPVTLF